MTGSGRDEARARFLESLQAGQVLTATVASLDVPEVIVDLPGPGGTHQRIGRVLESELSWQPAADPDQIVRVGQELLVEVIALTPGRDAVIVSARACEDPELRDFLLHLRPGDVVTGTVSDTQPFGVFVHLDGEPSRPVTGLPGTGFINVPELSWSHFAETSEIVTVGQRVTAKVLGSNTRRGQVSLSLRALQQDPLPSWADRVGQVVPGHVTKLTPIGVFVRLADGVEGLLELSVPAHNQLGDLSALGLDVGDPVDVMITEVEARQRRVILSSLDRPGTD